MNYLVKLLRPKPYKLISDDTMFMGSVDTIGKIINKLPNVTNINEIIHSHFWLANTFKHLKLYPNPNFPFSAGFIRPEL